MEGVFAFVGFADEVHALEGIKNDRETIGSRYQTGRFVQCVSTVEL